MAETFPFPGSPGSSTRATTLKIPTSQAKLLDRPDSWITSLKASNHSLGLVNLPTDVLTSLTNHYRSQFAHDAGEKGKRNGGKHGGSNEGRVDHSSPGCEFGDSHIPVAVASGAGATESPQPVTEEAALPSDSHGANISQPENASSPELFYTWSSSEEHQSDQPGSHDSPQIALAQPVAAVPPIGPEEEDYDDEEEELEVITPHGVKDTAWKKEHEAVERQSQPSLGFTATQPPPCGQGDSYMEPADDMDEHVPGTVHAENLPEGPARRHRRMQAPVFAALRPEQTAHRYLQLTAVKTPGTGVASLMLESSQASVSSMDESSSVAEQPEHKNHQDTWAQVPMSSDGPSPKRPRTSYQTSHENVTRREVLVPATPISTTCPFAAMAGSVSRDIQEPRPFDEFKMVYPDYSGSLGDFLRACICLEYLRREDSMRDLLYDDFIRVFTEGYVNYVATCRGNALPAYRWFNRIAGDVVFRKMIINRLSLSLVFKAYPLEIQAIGGIRERQGQVNRPSPAREAPAVQPGLGTRPEEARDLKQLSTSTHRNIREQPASQPPQATALNSQRPGPDSVPDTMAKRKRGPGDRAAHVRTLYPRLEESPLKPPATPANLSRSAPSTHRHVSTGKDPQETTAVSTRKGPLSPNLRISSDTSSVASDAIIRHDSPAHVSPDSPSPKAQTPRKEVVSAKTFDIDIKCSYPMAGGQAPSTMAIPDDSPSPVGLSDFSGDGTSTVTSEASTRHDSPRRVSPGPSPPKTQTPGKGVASARIYEVDVGYSHHTAGDQAPSTAGTPNGSARAIGSSDLSAEAQSPKKGVASATIREGQVSDNLQWAGRKTPSPTGRQNSLSSAGTNRLPTKHQTSTEQVAGPRIQEVNDRRHATETAGKEAEPSDDLVLGDASTEPFQVSMQNESPVSVDITCPSSVISPKKGIPGSKKKGVDVRRARHSIATANPRASSGNDNIKKVADGRVRKESGRRSLGGRSDMGRTAKEDALRAYILKRQAERRATASPATRS